MKWKRTNEGWLEDETGKYIIYGSYDEGHSAAFFRTPNADAVWLSDETCYAEAVEACEKHARKKKK